jgi:hypothetical protein
MNPLFDIFQMVPVDRVLWLGTAESLEEAQARIRELGAGSPGKYLVLCTRTGTGLIVNSSGSDLTTATDLADSALA